MSLTVYGFHDRPHEFAVTKVGAPLEECEFLLDFSRPLQKISWLGVTNRWVGVTIALMVPVVHKSEEKGEFVIGVSRGEPYFVDLPNLWREHSGKVRTIKIESIGGLELVAAFGKHFPDNC